MRFRDILASGRLATLQAEEDLRAQQLEGMRAVAHRVVIAARAERNFGWDRAMAIAVDPIAARRQPASDAVGRRWDRILASVAAKASAEPPLLHHGRIVGGRGAQGAEVGRRENPAIAADWDRALAGLGSNLSAVRRLSSPDKE